MNHSEFYSTTLYLPLRARDSAHYQKVVALLDHHSALPLEFRDRVLADTKRALAAAYNEHVLAEFPDTVDLVDVVRGSEPMLRIRFTPEEVDA